MKCLFAAYIFNRLLLLWSFIVMMQTCHNWFQADWIENKQKWKCNKWQNSFIWKITVLINFSLNHAILLFNKYHMMSLFCLSNSLSVTRTECASSQEKLNNYIDELIIIVRSEEVHDKICSLWVLLITKWFLIIKVENLLKSILNCSQKKMCY